MISKEQITTHKLFYLLLGSSILFFIIKGIQYAFIGSYLPLVFSVLAMIMLFYGLSNSNKAFKRVIKTWGIILIVWATARLVLEILFQLSPNVTASHIREQFTILQKILSILFLIIGIYLIRSVKDVINTK